MFYKALILNIRLGKKNQYKQKNSNMGWYTTGPGNLEFKYGNVLELATWLGSLGEFRVTPRVEVSNEAKETISEYSFLSEWQKGFEKNGYKWKHILFDEDDLVVDSNKFKPKAYKKYLKELVVKNIYLFRKLIRTLPGRENERIISASIEIEYSLHISKTRYQDILDCINPSKDKSLLTLTDIDNGTFIDDDTYFELPLSKSWMTKQLSINSILALNGVAFAYKNNEDFYLFQPGDDSWTNVWLCLSVIFPEAGKLD
jgi:hypothetical protein